MTENPLTKALIAKDLIKDVHGMKIEHYDNGYTIWKTT